MVPGITHIFVKNYTEQCLKNILEMQELTDIISCVILIHTRNSSNNILMTVLSMVVTRYYQIKQHKH